jgi:hypothetical protein
MTVRGKIRNGRVVLNDPCALPDETEVEVRPAKKRKPTAKAKKPKARPRTLLDRLANVIGKATGLPPDASVNHDHYLYGTPKQQLNPSSPTRPVLWPWLRYVECNPLRAGLTRSARRWRWSSLGRATLGLPGPPLETGPVAKPVPWQKWVDQPETEAELTALRRSVARGVPFGAESWQRQTAKRLGLESSLRPVGRPLKAEKVPKKQ